MCNYTKRRNEKECHVGSDRGKGEFLTTNSRYIPRTLWQDTFLAHYNTQDDEIPTFSLQVETTMYVGRGINNLICIYYKKSRHHRNKHWFLHGKPINHGVETTIEPKDNERTQAIDWKIII